MFVYVILGLEICFVRYICFGAIGDVVGVPAYAVQLQLQPISGTFALMNFNFGFVDPC